MGAHRRRDRGGAQDASAQKTPLGRRRTAFADAPDIDVDDIAAGDDRAASRSPSSSPRRAGSARMSGHVADLTELDFKEGDRLKRAFHAQTTDKLLVFATDGKVFTLRGGEAAGRPRPRRAGAADGRPGQGPGRRRRSSCTSPGASCSSPSAAGYGFVVAEDEVVATTRKGKQVLNVAGRTRRSSACRPRATMSRSSARTARCWSSRCRAAGDGARQGRAPAALQGRRALRCARVQRRGRPQLDRFRRAHA